MEKKLLHFQRLTLYVGIDLHKKQWTVSIYTDSIYHKTFSQAPRPEVLRTYIEHHFPGATVRCVYEATRFGFWIARELQSYGYECLVVNPADIPSTHHQSQNKTDPTDSRKLAKTLRAGLLNPCFIPSKITEGDRQLFRYRKRLLSDLNRVKNRIKGTLTFSGVTVPPEFDNSYWTKAFLQWTREVPLPSRSARQTLDLLMEQHQHLYHLLLVTTRQVRALLKEDRYRHQARLLVSVPGIGPLTSVQLLCEIEDIHRFPSFRKFNSFIGFKPTSHSSGEHDWKGHMTIRRHNNLRSDLVECAWHAIRKDPVLTAKYEELIKRMTGKRAIVVIARKLLSRIYHVLKYQEAYDVGRAA